MNYRFGFISNKTILSFDKDDRIYYHQGNKATIGCSVDFTAYGSNFKNDNSKSTYDVSVNCLGGDFNKPIYPMKKD